ncbi:hypothetical protein BDQ17DRAFT_1536215 [Cyathus striatus]|nr:hypothetical protein BDQ17DRAFT_1536215 [Cyathus striatus]
MEDDETELRNPFPSPPSHYTKYTSHNLKLLALLRERAPDPHSVNQYQVLADQTDLPDWPLVQLEKPRIDWILDEQDPYYEVFGDKWFIKETIPSLADSGGNQLYPADPSVGASESRANDEAAIRSSTEETRNMHQKCDTLEARLAELRISLQQLPDPAAEMLISPSNTFSDGGYVLNQATSSDRVTTEVNDALLWAEEIG